MKFKTAVIAALALVILTGAMSWDGAAAVAPTGVLPETGFYAATNSFPRNTVVDVTNLDNNKTVRVIVAAGLDTPGLLAVLSREAAEIIDLSNRSIGRIRISESVDPVTMLRSSPAASPNAPSSPQTFAGPAGQPDTAFFDRPGSAYAPESEWADDNAIIDLPEYIPPVAQVKSLPPAASAEPPRYQSPSVEKPPATDRYAMPEEYFVPGIVQAEEVYTTAAVDEVFIDESMFILSFEDTVQPPVISEATQPQIQEAYVIESYHPQEPAALNTFLSVSATDILEAGKYYVQLGVFGSAELAESGSARIGASFPLLLQNGGTDDKPAYRLLLGPLNQGESGAVLQRFRSTGYPDAFIRRN